MPGKFHYRNQAQRFDLYSFYSLITKCKIVELLDKNGHTPFDSDAMNDSVFDYAVQIYKDILDNGIVSYFDSDSFRHDSDGDGSNSWNGITRNVATARVYEPLRKWLYSQSNNGGIDDTDDEITSGFNRRYYSLPVSDSDGTIRHVNVYSFLKSHFNRWISYDSFERYKLTTNILRALQQDSDINNLFADQFLKACEEDSDLSRRAVEIYSNRLQSDSDIRQEIVTTAIEALSGLTPGGDSDRARELAEIVSAVLETDSEIRNEFGDYHITSLKEDSDQQVELGSIISNIDLVALNSPIVKTRQLLPMNGDDTGNIGDSEQKWSLINLTGLETDSTKIDNARKTSLIYINDSEGIMYYSTFTSFTDDSELVISRFKATTDSKFPTLRVKDLQSQGIVHISNDSEQTEIDRLITTDRFKFNDSDGIIYRGRKLIAIDSDVFFNLLLENETWYTLDSDGVRSTILETPVKSEYSWFIGQRGDVYVIGEDPPDSEIVVPFGDSDLTVLFGPEGNITGGEGTVGYFGLTSDGFGNSGLSGVYAPSLNLTADTGPGGNSTNVFKEGNTIYPNGLPGEFEISYKIAGFGFTGFSMFPTSASAEASRTYLGTLGGRVNNLSMIGYFYAQARLDNIQNGTSSAGSPYGGYRNQHFSGNITLASFHGGATGGSGGSIIVPGLTGGTFDSAYPTVVHQGRDSDNRLYIAVTGYDSTLSAMRRSPNYYFDGGSPTNATLKTLDQMTALGRQNSTYNTTDNLQLGYGNYDFYPVSQFRDISLTGNRSSVKVNKTNSLQTRSLVFTSDKVVDTSKEFTRALGDTVTKAQVFNTWYRISHRWNGGGTPGTFTYPANASEQNSWAFDAVNDVIYTTANTTTFCGFISPDTYDDFTFNSIVNAPYSGIADTGDDDSIISIVGFVTEGRFGEVGYREHTLSLVRTHGGFPLTSQGGPNVTWCLVYNYNQDDNRLLVNKSSSAPIATSPWNTSPHGSKLFIRRKGDSIVAYCSQMNDSTHTLDSDTEISWDLASDSDTLKFRGPVRYGYGAHSQQGSYWSDIFFKPDVGRYLHYVSNTTGFNSSSGGNVYVYDDINYSPPEWTIDSELTIDNTAGERMLHNEDTGKTFYNDPISDNVLQVMTSRKFTDVIALPPLAAEPDSDTLGRMGLRPNTFAMADGTNWDPSSLSGTTPYPVFYNGTTWLYFSLF